MIDLHGQIRNSKWANFVLLATLFWMVAAATFSGFMGKWALRDGDSRFSIEKMLDGSAHRPFVYRQLAPLISNFIEHHIPDEIESKNSNWRSKFEKFSPGLIFHRAKFAGDPKLTAKYTIISYIVFISILATLFIFRLILVDLNFSQSVSAAAPIIFMLSFPYLQTKGGYFYDYIEILFMAIAILFAQRGKISLLLLISIPATLNKESYLFFVPTLYPLLRVRCSKAQSIACVLFMLLMAGTTNIVMKQMFSDSPGLPMELHLVNQLHSFIRPSTYLSHEITYGIIGPGGMSVFTLLVLVIVVVRGWQACQMSVKRHILICLGLTAPLFILFCYPGELRNLSLLFPAMVIMIAHAVQHSLEVPSKASGSLNS